MRQRRPLVKRYQIPSLQVLAKICIQQELKQCVYTCTKLESDLRDSQQCNSQLSMVKSEQDNNIAYLKAELSKSHANLYQEQDRLATSEKNAIEILKAKAELEAFSEKKSIEMDDLVKSMSGLTLQCRELEEKVHAYSKCRYKLRAENFTDADRDVHYYTGFSTWKTFMVFFESLEGYDLCNLQYIGRERTFPAGRKRGPPRALNPLNEFFLTLVRLRLGLQERDLADRFSIAQSTVSVILNTWLSLLHRHLVGLDFWPTRDTVRKYMPGEFANSIYGDTRIIIDATELFIEKPSDLSLQSVTWSNYKSHNTLKGLIGIAPFGGVTFVSELWAGSISDIELTNKCGLLDLLQAGDNIMADKGFNIEEILQERGVTLNIPPFMRNGALSEHDVLLTRSIASLRIHVERAIERIKNFKILNGSIPNSIHPSNVSKMFYICSMLTNMQLPLVKPAKASDLAKLKSAASSRSLANLQSADSESPQLTPQELDTIMIISPATQKLVETNTKDQAQCELWHHLRSARLTSSNFGRIYKRKENNDTLAKELLNKKSHISTRMPAPLQWGVDHEPLAYAQYSKHLASSSPMSNITKSGLWIDLTRGWLACSPDGLVLDQDKNLVGILEIKCPYSAREMTVHEACEKISSFSCKLTDNNIQLKRNHHYFFQVQGQLAITGAPWCDFCVYTPIGIEVERIYPDQEFWQNLVQKLDHFYTSFYVPVLCNRHNIQTAEQALASFLHEC